MHYLPVLDLPPDARGAVYSRCSLPQVFGVFAQVSHQSEEKTAFSRLQLSAVNAEPESYKQADKTKLAAIAILKRHPDLLFKSARVTDHFNRTIEASAYRQFLGAGDVWALKQIHESIIPLIKNGEALAVAEFKAQFPYCPWYYHYPWLTPEMPEEALYDERNNAQIAAVKVILTEIVAKISADPCTNDEATLDETKKAVAALCQLFAPKEGEVIRTGLHFPLGIMQKIFEVYNDQYSLWSGDQLAYFSRTVIGAAEAALTAVDGQCYKNGIPDLYIDLGPDRRDGLFCRQPLGLPPTLTPLVGRLGNTVFVDPSNGESCILSSDQASGELCIPPSDPRYFVVRFYWYNKYGQGLPQANGEGYPVRGLSVLGQAFREIKANAIRAIMRQCAEKSTICFSAFDRPMQCVMF